MFSVFSKFSIKMTNYFQEKNNMPILAPHPKITRVSGWKELHKHRLRSREEISQGDRHGEGMCVMSRCQTSLSLEC